MGIRNATREDLPVLVAMGQNFREGSKYHKYLADNPEKMYKLGEDLLAKNGLLVYEANSQPVGMLGFIVYDHFISGEKVLGEVFWWVEPKYRGTGGIRLLRAAEKIAREAGAKHIMMIAPEDRVARFYVADGYDFVEATYQKEL